MFSEIRIFTSNDVADARRVVAALYDPEDKGEDDFYTRTALRFLVVLTLYYLYHQDDPNEHIKGINGEVRTETLLGFFGNWPFPNEVWECAKQLPLYLQSAWGKTVNNYRPSVSDLELTNVHYVAEEIMQSLLDLDRADPDGWDEVELSKVLAVARNLLLESTVR